MGRKTKLEELSYEAINKLSEKDLKKITRNAIKASNNRINAIKKSGYELPEMNETFLSEEKTWNNLRNKSLSDTRRIASYVKKHLESKLSSVEGLRQKDEDTLKLLAKMSGNNDYENVKIKRTKNFSYRMGGQTYTREDLSEFWNIVRKVDEDNSLQRLKEGSGSGIQIIHSMVFDEGIRNPAEILQKIKGKYKQEQEERANKWEQYERELEDVKRKGKTFRN